MANRKGMLHQSILLAAAIIAIFSLPAIALDVDIERMTQQAPYFDAYPGADGIVWYRSHDYSLLPDGRMEKSSTWVILARDNITSRWLNWSFPVLNGGDVEVIEAGVYDPGNSRLVAPVLPVRDKYQDMDVVSLKIPVLREEFIIHLSVREQIPTDWKLDDTIPAATDLPVWEEKFTLQVPAGTDVSYISSGLSDPVLTSGDGQQIYKWTAVGMDPWTERTLVKRERPYLAFSLRKGVKSISAELAAAENVSVPKPPAWLTEGSGFKSSSETVRRLVGHVESVSNLPEFATGIVRTSIPENGPWSSLEKSVVLTRWLAVVDIDAPLLWPSGVVVNEETPQARGLFNQPVVEINPKGVGSSFYIPGRTYPASISSFSLTDPYFYHVTSDGLETRTISPGTPSENRLSARWSLALEEDGSITGRIRLLTYNGWNTIFFGDNEPDPEVAKDLLEELTGGIVSGDVGLTKRTGSYVIEGDLQLPPAIMNADRALVMIPRLDVRQISQINLSRNAVEVAFPFMIKEEFNLSYPGNADLVALPSISGERGPDVSLDSSLRSNKRKNTVSGSLVLTVKNRDAELDAMRGPLKRWAIWSEKTLPFKFR